MSISNSKPFFSPNLPKAKSFQPVTDEEYKKLHWTRQLELRPLRTQKRWNNDANIDFDTRLDNWDDPEEQG